MTQHLSLERMVAAWMAHETTGTERAADQLIDQILDTTSRERPRPRWLALLKESPMHAQAQVAVGSPPRRMIFVIALLLAATLVAVGVGAAVLLRPPSIADDWPGFRGGASHESTGLVGPVGRPVVRWQFTADGPVLNNLAIVGDLVLAPTDTGTLHALGVADGKVRWTFRPGTSISGPTVADGTVYLADGIGAVRALELATGAELWQSRTLRSSETTTLAVAEGRVFVGAQGGELLALDAKSGAELWRVSIAPDGGLGNPSVAGGIVYVGSDVGLTAVRAMTGDIVWRADLGGDPTATAVVANGIVYVGPSADADHGQLWAIDAATGRVVWKIPERLYSPTVSAGLAISGSNIGFVTARDATTGAERWRFRARGIFRPPAVAGDIVYAPAEDERRVYALDLMTGAVLWQQSLDGPNQCCIAVAKGMVFVGTTTGSVYAIGGDGTTVVPQVASPVPAT
jgi:outer membrane protein assembly factor BamB